VNWQAKLRDEVRHRAQVRHRDEVRHRAQVGRAHHGEIGRGDEVGGRREVRGRHRQIRARREVGRRAPVEPAPIGREIRRCSVRRFRVVCTPHDKRDHSRQTKKDKAASQ
jgi:hypothetical protein